MNNLIVMTSGRRRAWPVARWSAALLALAMVCLLSSCEQFAPRGEAPVSAEKRAEDLQRLQLQVMRYADHYVGRISEALQRNQASDDEPQARLVAQEWKLQQATAAYTIASSPNPAGNALDMVVLAALSRMVTSDPRSNQRFGGHAELLAKAHSALDSEAWLLLEGVLTEEQIKQVRAVIERWRAEHPQVGAVAFVRLQNFSKGIRNSEGKPDRGPVTLVSALGLDRLGLDKIISLDPFKDLDPAVREITQTRHLAERTIYYAQRAPSLIDMEVEHLLNKVTTMPETRQLLGNVDRVSKAADATGQLATTLPDVLAREREAAIRQFMNALSAQEAQTRQLLAEMRSTLETGTGTSESLNATIRSLDAFMARFDKASAARDPNAPPSKPFDINEYTAMARELGTAANQLQALVVQLDAASPAVTRLSATTAAELQKVVDHAYLRGVQLILILVTAVLAAALLYRFAAPRLRRLPTDR